ncbi:MAG: hypothetical protein AAFR81_06525 [Chloroflexota bacterium]
MGRVINNNTPGKKRSHMMRTIAEIVRRLGQKGGTVDDDVRDMTAMIVFCLREIDESIIETIKAWEKRGYWQKADRFQREWMWSGDYATKLERIVRDENWSSMPDVMMQLFPHFADIEINRLTRNPDEWQGAYERLLEDA